jgi:propionyl-CoA carboxylase alpha chain
MTSVSTLPRRPANPIRTLLVANRGEIARRIMRTARSMGMTTVAVYSDADADSPHVAEADLAVRLPGVSPADTYLRSALLLDAATRAGADAIHPGYGFLSESGDFARVAEGAGLTWVGPSPAAIDAMGSKVGAKELMRVNGVPTLPSLVLDDDEIPEFEDVEAFGWPVMIKASAGGGGRGMRIVSGPVNLRNALEAARREAEAAFGDGTVFLERYVVDPRHIEVQILADAYGDTVALFERECSIQRRHQKIIEEAPAPTVGAELRERLVDAAVSAAKAVGYVNAGTVEFVVDQAGDPYFLEMNTRLQVEHPVTEAITGLDLVRLQLLIAQGEPLPPEVHEAVAAGPNGHAIEARLYAEDPTQDWLPSTGLLSRFDVGGGRAHRPASPGNPALAGSRRLAGSTVRVDSGVESGSVVTPHYDAMLAKVIVHAPTRSEAAATLAATIARARIHGITTNRDLLANTLRHPGFLSGDTDTGFLERHSLRRLAASLTGPEAVGHHAIAAALFAEAERRRAARVQSTIPSGFRNNPFALQQTTYEAAGQTMTVAYRLEGRCGSVAQLELDGVAVDVERVRVTTEAIALTISGLSTEFQVDRVGAVVYVDGPDGSSVLVEQDRFPEAAEPVAEGSARAPMPGAVVRVAVAVGDTVRVGQELVVLEAMKMEHSISAATSGRIAEVHVTEGDQVESGRILVVVEEQA